MALHLQLSEHTKTKETPNNIGELDARVLAALLRYEYNKQYYLMPLLLIIVNSTRQFWLGSRKVLRGIPTPTSSIYHLFLSESLVESDGLCRFTISHTMVHFSSIKHNAICTKL